MLGGVMACLATAPAQVVIIDNGETGFATVGTWGASANTDRFGVNSVFNTVGVGADSATWTPSIPESGYYDVYATWTVSANRARRAEYTINHKNGSTTVLVNQEQGLRRWNHLGRYEFDAGTGGTVVLSDNGPGEPISDVVVADAVRFEKAGFATANIPLAWIGSNGASNLCAFATLPGALEDHPLSKYFLVSDMPEIFGYPSAGPVTKSDGVLYSTELTIPDQTTGYPPAPWNQQVVNGYTTIDDDFDIFLFHIAQPGDTSRPRRIVIYARNNSVSDAVDVAPSQVLVTDGVIGFVHEMESNLATRFTNSDYDNTGLGTVTIPAGEGRVIGFSKKFAIAGNSAFISQNVNCFGRLRGLVSGTNPNLDLYIVAIDTSSANVAPVVAGMKTAVETILASATPGAIELESFQFDNAPTGATLRRSTGVFPHKVWRSNVAFDLHTLPGGATFQMGLDAVRTSGCDGQRQTVDALLYPPYLRGESIGNYMTDHRVLIRVQNSSDVARDFDLQFGRSDAADIGLMYQVATGTTPPDDAMVDATTPLTKWAGGIQVANVVGGKNFESFLGTPLNIPAGEERYVAVRFQILGNSSTPFQLLIPDTRGPVFDRIASSSAIRKDGESTTVSFFSSDQLGANPTLTVAGSSATFSAATANNYTYVYTVQPGDPEGDAPISATGSDSAGNSGSTARSGILTIDLSAPTSAAAVDPLQVGANIAGSYSATDAITSVASTRIYYRAESGSWTDGGAVTGGTFTINAPTPGRYFLKAVSSDTAGNAEAAPSGSTGTGDASVVFNTPNGSLTLLVSGSGTLVFPTEAGAPIKTVAVELFGVTTPGTLTVQRVESQGTLPSGFEGAQLIGERVTVTPAGGLAFSTANLHWDYDNANSLSPAQITRAYAQEGVLVTDYPAVATASTIEVENITGFSTWFAGTSTASVEEWNLLAE